MFVLDTIGFRLNTMLEEGNGAVAAFVEEEELSAGV